MDKVVHFELPIDNLDRAKKFYKETFSWDIENIPELKYFKKSDLDVAVTGPTFSIDVQDIDEAIKKIKNAGGLILKNKTEMPAGYVAYFKDTEGNILSIWQSTNKTQ